MKKEQAIFAAGCFWGVQYQLQRVEGVIDTKVGYIGGEAVLVDFDAEVVSYEQLCKVFFEIHDPAQTDGIGPDIGPQYRSEIFYLNDEQKQTAEEVIELLRSKGYEVNTRLRPSERFWEGEEYHQDYYNKTGDEPYCHIRTKKF